MDPQPNQHQLFLNLFYPGLQLLGRFPILELPGWTIDFLFAAESLQRLEDAPSKPNIAPFALIMSDTSLRFVGQALG